MRDAPTRIDELDLLAYADGRLGAERAAEVEAFLNVRPEVAAKVRDFSRQNEELRDHFARYLDEPLPLRLRSVLEQEPRPVRPIVVRALAAGLLMIAAGLGGWWYGQDREQPPPSLERFLSQAAGYYQAPPERAGAPAEAVTAVGGGQPLNWLWNRISLGLEVPDLRDEGYRLVDKRRVFFDGVKGVSLSYKSGTGDVLTVFVKGRWQETAPGFEVVRSGDVGLVYWMNGPLVVAVAGPGDETDRLKRLAHKVQDALARGAADAGPQLEMAPSAPVAAQNPGLNVGTNDPSQPAQGLLDPSSVPQDNKM